LNKSHSLATASEDIAAEALADVFKKALNASINHLAMPLDFFKLRDFIRNSAKLNPDTRAKTLLEIANVHQSELVLS
jgi:hypothetical protein